MGGPLRLPGAGAPLGAGGAFQLLLRPAGGCPGAGGPLRVLHPLGASHQPAGPPPGDGDTAGGVGRGGPCPGRGGFFSGGLPAAGLRPDARRGNAPFGGAGGSPPRRRSPGAPSLAAGPLCACSGGGAGVAAAAPPAAAAQRQVPFLLGPCRDYSDPGVRRPLLPGRHVDFRQRGNRRGGDCHPWGHGGAGRGGGKLSPAAAGRPAGALPGGGAFSAGLQLGYRPERHPCPAPGAFSRRHPGAGRGAGPPPGPIRRALPPHPGGTGGGAAGALGGRPSAPAAYSGNKRQKIAEILGRIWYNKRVQPSARGRSPGGYGWKGVSPIPGATPAAASHRGHQFNLAKEKGVRAWSCPARNSWTP